MAEPVSAALPIERMSLLESYQAARRNILEIIPDAALDRDIISGRTGPQRWHMVMMPKAIRKILLENVENYPKSTATKAVLEPAIGESLFTAEGANWRWQRRAAAPAFSARNVAQLTPVMSAAAEAACQRMEGHIGRGVNCLEEMTSVTYDIITRVSLGEDGTVDRAEASAALDHYIDQAARISMLDMVGAPSWIPRPGRKAAAAQLSHVQSQLDQAIDERRKSGSSEQIDLLDLILDAADPKSGRAMTTEEMRHNLLTFIVAGHETTALTLAWALYLLAGDSAAQTKARDEAQAVLGDRIAEAKDVENLPFIRQVIEENLRLYPPGGFLSRTAQADDELEGAQVRQGDTVIIPVYGVHRHRKLWDAPNEFRPERWENRSAIDRYQFLPFGDGPRICIGAAFAMQEAIVILASMLARFRFKSIKGKEPKPVMILTLRPEGGVWLEVERV